MNAVLEIPRAPVTNPPASGEKNDISDIAYHPARTLWMQLQDPDVWQDITGLPTYAEWLNRTFIEEGIATSILKVTCPHQVRAFDIAVCKVNMRINRGVTKQFEADRIMAEVRKLVGMRM